jgi:NAD(P)-dependent dehydrogenase (short-subunit alcohol dehydrogenase family)
MRHKTKGLFGRAPGDASVSDKKKPINMFDLTGKVALVTGGNSGLGFGFARGLAKAGSDVMIWSRRADRNAEAVAKLQEYGTRIMSAEVDVSSEEQIVAGVADLIKKMGRLDTVVANAGAATQSPFHEMDAKTYHDMLNVAMHGSFFVLREGSKHMVERAKAGDPGGSLIICGSGSIYQGVPTMAHYALVKGGLNSMSKTLAAELGQYGIRSNVIAPGFIITEMTMANPEVGKMLTEMVSKKTPLGRPGFPEDLEGAVVYLASDASRYHTGDTLMVDGGKVANN